MLFESKGKLLESLIKCLPYADQIKDLDLDAKDAILFTWRSERYKIERSGSVYTTDGAMLYGSDLAILLRELLKRQFIQDELKK